jgi:hypothetical protein
MVTEIGVFGNVLKLMNPGQQSRVAAASGSLPMASPFAIGKACGLAAATRL